MLPAALGIPSLLKCPHGKVARRDLNLYPGIVFYERLIALHGSFDVNHQIVSGLCQAEKIRRPKCVVSEAQLDWLEAKPLDFLRLT